MRPCNANHSSPTKEQRLQGVNALLCPCRSQVHAGDSSRRIGQAADPTLTRALEPAAEAADAKEAAAGGPRRVNRPAHPQNQRGIFKPKFKRTSKFKIQDVK